MAGREWTPKEHPRLFFDPGDLEALRAKRSVDEVARSAWGRIQDGIGKAMALDSPRWSDRWEWDTGSDNQKNLFSVGIDLMTAVSCLGLSWLLDRQESHARKAVDLLMSVCDFDFWTSPRFFGTDYRLPWRGTLETAWMCHAAGWGYDWLHDFMNEKERHRLRTCLLYKGILPLVQDWADPLTRLPLVTHMLPWGNWWQNCIAPAGEAVMSVYGEHPLAERFARLCKEASDWFFRFEGASVPEMPKELLLGEKPGTAYPPNFDSEGGYWEGLMYIDGPLMHSFHFAEAYRRQVGKEIIPLPLLKKVAEFILNGSFRMGDRMRAANFGDCRAGWATLPEITGYLARRLRHGGLQWFLHNCQKNYGEASLFRYHDFPAFAFLWYDPTLVPEEPAKASSLKVYPLTSWAVMRNGWGREHSMLAFVCGATAGHAHPDAGSFVLYSRDQLLLIDSGCCGYEMPEQNGYYQTTRAHNSVLVGGEGQVKRLSGKIVEQAAVPGLAFVLGDATAPYEGRLSRFHRGILFVADQYYIVVDWLAKPGDGKIAWLLHYDGEMIRREDGYHITKGRANLLVRVIEPAQHHMAVRQGYKTYHEDLTVVKSSEEKQKELEPGDYLEITAAENARKQKSFTVLYPFAEGAEPRIEAIHGKGWTGVRISRGAEQDLVGLRMSGGRAPTELEGVRTDAELFCVSFDGKGNPRRLLLRAGSSLKYNGRSLASFKAPVCRAIALKAKGGRS